MDTVKVKTPDDFLGPPKSPKRKRHISIACECCRKLKIRYVNNIFFSPPYVQTRICKATFSGLSQQSTGTACYQLDLDA